MKKAKVTLDFEGEGIKSFPLHVLYGTSRKSTEKDVQRYIPFHRRKMKRSAVDKPH